MNEARSAGSEQPRVRAEARTHMVERVSTKHVGPGFSPASGVWPF